MKFDIKIALLALIGVTWAKALIPNGTTGLPKRSFSAGAKNVVITDPALIHSSNNRAAKEAAAKAATSGVPKPTAGMTPPVPKAQEKPAVVSAAKAPVKAQEKVAATGPITLADLKKDSLKKVGTAHLDNKQIKPSVDTNPIVNPALLTQRIAGLKKVETKTPLEVHKEEMDQKKKAEEVGKAKAEAAAKAAVEAKAQTAPKAAREAKTDAAKPVPLTAAQIVASTVPAKTDAASKTPTQTTQKPATVDAPTKTEQGSLKPKEVFHHEHVHNHYHHFVKAA